MELCWSEEDFRKKFAGLFDGEYAIGEHDIPTVYPCICYYWVSEAGNRGCIESVLLDNFIDGQLIDYIDSKR